jgi:hypothetical protein
MDTEGECSSDTKDSLVSLALRIQNVRTYGIQHDLDCGRICTGDNSCWVFIIGAHITIWKSISFSIYLVFMNKLTVEITWHAGVV